MLCLHYYKEGHPLQVCQDIDRISDLISEPSNVVWLDAQNPTQEEIDRIAEEFGFHQLAIDNFTAPHNRPEVDEYPGYLFIVAMYPYYSRQTERMSLWNWTSLWARTTL
jgi:magnesium transporter